MPTMRGWSRAADTFPIGSRWGQRSITDRGVMQPPWLLFIVPGRIIVDPSCYCPARPHSYSIRRCAWGWRGTSAVSDSNFADPRDPYYCHSRNVHLAGKAMEEGFIYIW
ncbi:hypothetical protein M758_UG140700 [Ceratodon purpureus]|nr:hypothetical protein M758_UG140700 [Ceratodon purpureus]